MRKALREHLLRVMNKLEKGELINTSIINRSIIEALEEQRKWILSRHIRYDDKSGGLGKK